MSSRFSLLVGVLLLAGLAFLLLDEEPARITVPMVTAGDGHTIALKSDGTVWAWGDNRNGQLGVGTTMRVITPKQILSFSGVVAVAAGDSHTLALKSDGTVWAWGKNSCGQIGNSTWATVTAPVQVTDLSRVSAIAAGYCSSMALKSDGTVWVWGSNNADHYLTPKKIMELSGITAIAAGYNHMAALKSDGTVWTWGDNEYNQLGMGFDRLLGIETPRKSYAAPAKIRNLDEVTAIVAGHGYTAVLKSDGTVWTWGRNIDQLGRGSDPIPRSVKGLSGVRAIAANSSNLTALRSDGTVWGRGSNFYGQLGTGAATEAHAALAQAINLSGITAIAAGGYHTVALKSDGTVWAWGCNQQSQLGNGRFGHEAENTPFPVQVTL